MFSPLFAEALTPIVICDPSAIAVSEDINIPPIFNSIVGETVFVLSSFEQLEKQAIQTIKIVN
jgi:hypothetical protein